MRIAFTRNGVLNVINADGTGLTALPTAPEGARYPAWSPDGAHIAYGTNGGSWPIYIANADGSNLVRLTTDTLQKEMPRWSPDGRQLVFARVLNRVFQLFVINADGTGEVKLSATAASEAWPSWSPLP
jgi:TolB protein